MCWKGCRRAGGGVDTRRRVDGGVDISAMLMCWQGCRRVSEGVDTLVGM
jgi:hypothetical protein